MALDEQKISAKIDQPAKAKPVNLDRYQDLEGVSMKKLETGLWYIEHKALLRNILIVILALIGAVTWIITLSTFGLYVFKGMVDDMVMANQLVATQGFDHAYIKQISGQQLEVYPVRVLESANIKGEPRYDMIVEVKNPNLRHAGVLNYSLVSGDETITGGVINLLPGDDKYITALGLALENRPQNVQLVNNRLDLRRLDVRTYPDWDKYKKEHLNIVITDAKFTPPRLTGLSEKLNVSQLDFTATNDSAYNFWRADLVIMLYNRGQLVAVNQYLVDRLKSGEKREITISLPGVVKVDQIEIIPQVDILDQKNYFDFEAGGTNPVSP
jgi:hypothetical protein